ncbi:hypothetical protein CAOG_009628 [Capsaspora owczarzaki ATCC 30864]|uniref:Uncharacterized protein n=1 Tax=Capsaspora owczarzaki (strain ATCC 30864) TaxID=595528 RepID=A0A0D2VNW7_CAPO3|nr:hypothetical protein CAOG_009628 [Capsaspora owczarzaki ATCC 30864]
MHLVRGGVSDHKAKTSEVDTDYPFPRSPNRTSGMFSTAVTRHAMIAMFRKRAKRKGTVCVRRSPKTASLLSLIAANWRLGRNHKSPARCVRILALSLSHILSLFVQNNHRRPQKKKPTTAGAGLRVVVVET